ncbi:MAG: branched-chain amino acid ABC transporter permease [Deltaproteobacteria bacterium]|jgi:branched-chain amino acid transport system permease protein|nr:branched-chain amino acid ABC transporter permease [Deltaproteobacteria bacterium]MBT4643150.1 branched-chain amino acid ABC transporter permease [Deltaproteobacteria bacterium]
MELRESYAKDIRILDKYYKWGWLVILGIGTIILSQGGGDYSAYMLNLILINIIAGIGLNILTGYTGLISLGHAAFMAIGAYSSVILTAKFGFPFPLALVSSVILTGLVGFLVGIPSLRLTGMYLMLVTMAFGFVVDEIILQSDGLTGGADGLGALPPTILGVTFDTYQKYFFITFICLALSMLCAKNILRGGFGRTLMAIRDSETAAESMGINLGWYKALSFTISSAYAGLAGVLYAHFLLFISVDNFTLLHSISYIVMIVVGGIGTLIGSVMGATFITVLPEIITFAKDYLPEMLKDASSLQAAIYGIILMVFVIYQPTGLFGLWMRIKVWWAKFPL